MSLEEELRQQVFSRKVQELGCLSDGAKEELKAAIQTDLDRFCETDQEQSSYLLLQALDAFREDQRQLELCQTESQFLSVRLQILDRLSEKVSLALAKYPHNLDATHLMVLLESGSPNDILMDLLDLKDSCPVDLQDYLLVDEDIHERLELRAYLRLLASIDRFYLDTGRALQAKTLSELILSVNPSDSLGVSNTLVLALARLEDLKELKTVNHLRFRQDNSWMHLARTLILYKLDRMSAARRSLLGMIKLCEGSAFALLRPSMTEMYLLQRPPALNCSFEEVQLAVREAEPVLEDTPEFIRWVSQQPETLESAQAFARSHGFDF